MDRERFEEHLSHPYRRGAPVGGGRDGSAGGAPCGDLVRVSLAVRDGRVAAVSFDASGCGSAIAAGSAAATLADGAPVIDVARIGPYELADELGGLPKVKFHCSNLGADALHLAINDYRKKQGLPPLAEPAGMHDEHEDEGEAPSCGSGH